MCGPPRPTLEDLAPVHSRVGGEPALFDRLGPGLEGTKQVLWPATLQHRDTGFFSVYGELLVSELERVAASMGAAE